jgi:galacturan 1,4-alpha-galacturonidase
MMHYSLFLSSALLVSFGQLGSSAPSLSDSLTAREETCTVNASGFESIDDSLAINDAISQCGNGTGIIKLPADQIYSIRSPINFTGCWSCDVQLEGELLLTTDPSVWGKERGFIVFDSVRGDERGARLRSLTGKGLINGQAKNLFQRMSHPVIIGSPTPSFMHLL